MLCSKEELVIYKKFYESIQNGTVKPYEEELINKLKMYRNKDDMYMKNYYDSLCSNLSSGKSFLFSHYLMLFLDNKKYKICNGYLSAFNGKKFSHTWIEGENEVYDVTFIGKWPKEKYYELFKPVVEIKEKVDSNEVFIKNNVLADKTSTLNASYVDWYNYMEKNTINTHALIEPLKVREYPVLTKKYE